MRRNSQERGDECTARGDPEPISDRAGQPAGQSSRIPQVRVPTRLASVYGARGDQALG